MDVKLEGKPLGRVEIELFDDLAVGSARFRDLAVSNVTAAMQHSNTQHEPCYPECPVHAPRALAHA